MTLVRPKKRFLFGGAGALLALAAITILVLTQVQSGSATHGGLAPAHAVNQYSAKFLCGPIAGPADPNKQLAPGMYNTAINIHNANDFDVTIQKKAVISVEERLGSPWGIPSARRQPDVLKADASMEVDCADIAILLGPTPPPPTNACWPTGGTTTWTSFCKGYAVIEAARIVPATPTQPAFGVPAQLDVTDILTVKEEDGIWKDYTFQLVCTNLPLCPQVAAIRYSSPTGSYAVYGSLVDINLPVRPPIPPCYDDFVLPCKPYDTDREIRNALQAYCTSVGGLLCNNFTLIPPPLYVQFKEADFATDSRDVSLDFEFVNPKVVRYTCWPKGVVAGC